MSYKKELYQKTKDIISQRKRTAENIYAQRHSEVCLKIPEIVELEQKMAQTGLDAVKAIGLGENAQKHIDIISKINLSAQKRRTELLIKNGYDENYLKPPYTCENCKDSGLHNGRVCECFTQLLKKLAYDEFGKTTPMKLSDFDSFSLHYYPDEYDSLSEVNPRKHMADVLSFCKQYANSFNKNSQSLMFFGRTGLGKTHLSLAIAGQVVKMGYNVIYNSTPNLMSRLEKEHFGKMNSDIDTEELVYNCDLLILDDLGSEFQTNFTTAQLYNIVNNRLLNGLPTIINTNSDTQELADKYGERIASRLIGGYMVIGFCGNDIRQIKSML